MDLKSLQVDFTRFVERVKGKAAVLQRKAAVLLCWEDGVQEFEIRCCGDPEHLDSDEHESKPPGQIQPPQYAQSSSGDPSRSQSPQTSVTRHNGDNSTLRLFGGDDPPSYTFCDVRGSASECQSPNRPFGRAVDLRPPNPAVSRSGLGYASRTATDSRRRETPVYYHAAMHAHASVTQSLDEASNIPDPTTQGFPEPESYIIVVGDEPAGMEQGSAIGTLNNHDRQSSIASGSTLILPNPDYYIPSQEVEDVSTGD
ncbi:uncharacterized protein BDV17DRAFT_295499 [Aspergillus undulatus]|uniref:uncharacterized protein n=1 Tax=Aspergillus undulatus TaxID=1810928 RepID=UPI003CCCE1F3